MEQESVINAYQKILPSFAFPKANGFPEEFAQKRFLKKMEVPDSTASKARRDKCWADWIAFDKGLPKNLRLPRKTWYKARAIIHDALRDFAVGDVDFSSGSEFSPRRGFQSVQQKLSHSEWDCTPSNLRRFADACYHNPALKKAVRERFKNLLQKHNTTRAEANRIMWKRLDGLKPEERTRTIWQAMVQMVVKPTHGSRFSTVRKNNEKDRPINVEGFCNTVTQRQIGLGLRELLWSYFGINLENGKQIHSEAIFWSNKATIDLSNASDSVTIALVRFLFPRWFVKILDDVRSPMVYGLDGNFHWTNKISAMGNGFTFELMTLILTALTRCYDSDSLVYGDDIIVDNSVAREVIKDLEDVGFIVNKEKSFIDSPFRESCGANYLDGYGYIDSFDFEYPNSIGDCVMLHNKALILSKKYDSFKALYACLTRVISDDALLGRWVCPVRKESDVPAWELPPYFARDRVNGNGEVVSDAVLGKSIAYLRSIQSSGTLRFFWGWSFEEELATKTLRKMSSRQWAKYFMYLHAGRVSKDVLVGHGRWRRVLFITDGTFTTRWKSLCEGPKKPKARVVGAAMHQEAA